MMDAPVNDTPLLRDAAERALSMLRKQGFDDAQAGAWITRQDEINIAHNEPSLMRSTEALRLTLSGLVDGRLASTELSTFDDDTIATRVRTLFEDARTTPQDAACAISRGQRARIEQGPQEADVGRLADAIAGLLRFRERETPTMMIDESDGKHVLQRWHLLTTGDSELSGSLGWYSLNAMGTAREGSRSSSFNYTGGRTNALDTAAPQAHFGIGEMLRETTRQVSTRALGDKFTGDVVFTPSAFADLVGWLLGQIADPALIAGTSLYRERVGESIGSPLLGLKSRFDAPGIAAMSSDAFVASPVTVLQAGVLRTLTPTLYGSRKTGLPHVPLAASGGWEVPAGETPRDELIAGVGRGALVSRLSMGNPASNGDFSSVVKNSFALQDGRIGDALSGTMIAGNIAQLLKSVVAVSRERIDTGGTLMPWVRVSGLHFS